MAGNKFNPDILHRLTGVQWGGGDVAILDSIEEKNGIPDDGTDYVVGQHPQVRLLKPFEHTDFVGTPIDGVCNNAFDSDPHPTGTPEYVDQPFGGYTGILPTKEQFATGYIFYMRPKVTGFVGGWYANFIINIKKLREDLSAQSNPPPFELDIALQRIYTRAFPPGDARPFLTAMWSLRIFNIPLDKFQIEKTKGEIVPIDPAVLPTGIASLVVKHALEGQPGFPAPVLTVIPIKEHALFDGIVATFADPKKAPPP